MNKQISRNFLEGQWMSTKVKVNQGQGQPRSKSTKVKANQGQGQQSVSMRLKEGKWPT